MVTTLVTLLVLKTVKKCYSDKTFKPSDSQLRVHERTHTGEKPVLVVLVVVGCSGSILPLHSVSRTHLHQDGTSTARFRTTYGDIPMHFQLDCAGTQVMN